MTSVSAGPPFGGLYLKPPSSGGLCDGVTTIPSARCSRAIAVVDKDRVRDDRRRRIAVRGIDPDLDAVRGQHPERGVHRRPGQRVGVATDEQWPVGSLTLAVATDRLGGGGDVRLVERAVQRGSAMTRRPERDPLGRIRRVRPDLEVRPDEAIDVDQHRWLGRLSGMLVDRHRASSPARGDLGRYRPDGAISGRPRAATDRRDDDDAHGSGRQRCCTGRRRGSTGPPADRRVMTWTTTISI